MRSIRITLRLKKGGKVEQSAALVARLGVAPLLSRADIEDGLTESRFEAIDQTLKGGVGEEISRVKIWNREGTGRPRRIRLS